MAVGVDERMDAGMGFWRALGHSTPGVQSGYELFYNEDIDTGDALDSSFGVRAFAFGMDLSIILPALGGAKSALGPAGRFLASNPRLVRAAMFAGAGLGAAYVFLGDGTSEAEGGTLSTLFKVAARTRGGVTRVLLRNGRLLEVGDRLYYLPKGIRAGTVRGLEALGDALQADVNIVRRGWSAAELSGREARAIEAAIASPRYRNWLPRLLEREAIGRYVHLS